MIAEHSARNTVTTAQDVPLNWIRPSSLNPRKVFDETALDELAASITEYGLLEPIVVRALSQDQRGAEHLEIIAGERRWRAAKRAGLVMVPIRNLGEISDDVALRLALVENLQRQDLDPIEEAEGFRALNRVCGLKQTEIAAAVSRTQSTIANRIRLLELPEDVQQRIRSDELSPAHGVALARWAKFPAVASALADLAVQRKLTSKDLEDKDALRWFPSYVESGPIRTLSSRTFDTTICEKCPFEARRHLDYRDVCLNPAHFEELAVAHRTAVEAAALNAQRVVEVKASGEVVTLPDLDKLQSDKWREIRSTPVAGCDELCPCRGKGLRYGRETQACFDPRRYEKLERKDTIAKNKIRRADADAKANKLTAAIDRLNAIGVREVSLIYRAILDNEWRVPSRIADALKRLEVEISDRHDLVALANVGTINLVRSAVEGILRAELLSYREGERPDSPRTDWYLGAAEASGGH